VYEIGGTGASVNNTVLVIDARETLNRNIARVSDSTVENSVHNISVGDRTNDDDIFIIDESISPPFPSLNTPYHMPIVSVTGGFMYHTPPLVITTCGAEPLGSIVYPIQVYLQDKVTYRKITDLNTIITVKPGDFECELHYCPQNTTPLSQFGKDADRVIIGYLINSRVAHMCFDTVNGHATYNHQDTNHMA